MAEDSTIEEAWTADAESGFGSNHHAAAVLGEGDDAVIAVPLNGVTGTDDCRVLGLDADGEETWTYQVPGEDCHAHAVGDVASGAFPADDSFLVATGEQRVHALDRSTGEEAFGHDVAEFGLGAPAVADDALVSVDFFGTAVAVDADGNERWRHDLGFSVWTGPAVVPVDGDPTVVVVGGETGDSGTVASLTADGDRRFETSLDAAVMSVEPTVVGGDPAVVVAARDGTVAAISAVDGEVIWRISVDENARIAVGDDADRPSWLTVADLGGDPAPVVATPDGTVAVLDPDDGDVHGSHETGADLFVAPTAADVTDDGTDELVVYGDGSTALLTIDVEK